MEKAPTSISEAQRVRNLEGQLAAVLQQVNIPNIRVYGRVITIREIIFLVTDIVIVTEKE